MKKILSLLIALVVILSLSFGCAGLKSLVGGTDTGVWGEIYDIARTGEVQEDVFYKIVEFEDGFGFYFGTSPTDNSIAILTFSRGIPPNGVAIRIKDGKAYDPSKLLLTTFGMTGISCEMAEAEEIAQELLKAYKEKLKTTLLKVKGVQI